MTRFSSPWRDSPTAANPRSSTPSPGASQHVANYPGVTVDKMSGWYKHNGRRIDVVDLPGTYSLTSYSPEERVSRDFLLHDKPSVTVNVMDAANLKRCLYLTFQLTEMDIPVILNLNMMDVVRKRGMDIDVRQAFRKTGHSGHPHVHEKRRGEKKSPRSHRKGFHGTTATGRGTHRLCRDGALSAGHHYPPLQGDQYCRPLSPSLARHQAHGGRQRSRKADPRQTQRRRRLPCALWNCHAPNSKSPLRNRRKCTLPPVVTARRTISPRPACACRREPAGPYPTGSTVLSASVLRVPPSWSASSGCSTIWPSSRATTSPTTPGRFSPNCAPSSRPSRRHPGL